jgi:isoleucyl-tRNA synthetase
VANTPKKHFLADIEESLLKQWEADHTFERSLKNREGGKVFSFYDGPPFANGTPHYGHLLQTTIKDTVTRYKTMRGYYVPRRIGWDTHGLPVEYAIEKEHGFKGKQDIIKYGIDKFNAECRDSVFKYKDIWEDMFRRVGRWADYDKTYATLDESYIESVWNVFQTIYDKGLVYKDFRSAPYCPRCATPLSNFELNQGYQDDVEDPSLFVKFKLTDEDAYLLGWTTTPWSLPGNAAIAVKPDAEYVYVELKDDDGKAETVVLARERLEALNVETYHITKELMGKDLVGKSYEPLFKLGNLSSYDNKANLYKIWPAEFVSTEDGSGVLHIAPAFGEDDLNLGKKHDLPVILSVDDNGKVKADMSLPEEFAGKFFKSADKHIIAHLTHKDRVYSAETIRHTYPFCWRCDTPLLYYATDSWLVKVTAVKDQLVSNNKEINWVPQHIQQGRFGNWLDNARDWAISRNRFWGAPLPVWVTDDGEVTVIGSVEELKKRATDPSKINDLHRPFIDDIEIKTESGKIAKRIPEVFDCWFESGAMPYAQDHYPFEDKQGWEERFPADFIAEAVDQTRGWFYTLHVLATALFNKPAFQNVICSGWIVAADGEKLSKRKKNYAPMDDIFDQYGVDSMRFFMASSPLVNGEDTRFSTDFLRDVQRKIFMTLNNIFSFYKLYADVDGYNPPKPLSEPQSDNILDQWILSRLNETIAAVTKAMDDYRLDRATRPIQELLDDASNWYVRRSRRRFWKSEDDSDKQQAYATLHYTLLRLCQLLAPFSPFLPDHLWQQLVKDTDLPKSVHLSDWPEAGKANESLTDEMAQARGYIADGLAQRAEAKIKVRQPLQSVTVPELPKIYQDIIAEELNTKEVKWGKAVKLDTKLTPELKREGLMREVVRYVQKARKDAGLDVDNRINLHLKTDDKELSAALEDSRLTDIIKHETLAKSLTEEVKDGYSTTVKVEGAELTISLAKA